jgi:hypothetical protein
MNPTNTNPFAVPMKEQSTPEGEEEEKNPPLHYDYAEPVFAAVRCYSVSL